MKLRLIVFCILAPLLAMIGYLAFLKSQVASSQIVELEARSELLVEAETTNALIHQLQRERGFSAGFIASKGRIFVGELLGQRAQTDAILEEFSLGLPATAAAFPDVMQEAQEALAELETWRANVDSFDFSVPVMAGNYTGLINNLLIAGSANAASSGMSGADRVQGLINAKAYLDQAKEAAGLERAMGATGLGAGAFSPAIYTRLVSLGEAQRLYLSLAIDAYADLALVDRLFANDFFRNADGMRKILTAAPFEGNFGDLTGPEWFQTSSEWIDHLRNVEIALSDELAVLANQQIDQTQRTSNTETGLLLLGCLAAVIFSMAVASALVRALKAKIAIMERFTEGDFDVDTPRPKGQSELAIMARAIASFKDTTLAMRENILKAKKNDEAELNAKHQKVVELVKEGLAELANANLTQNFETPLNAEYDTIRKDFNSATARLHDVLYALRDAVSDLSSRANSLSDATSDLRTRNERQSETIEQTAQSVSAANAVVHNSFEDLKQAGKLAKNARKAANASRDTVKNAVEAMDRISASSEEISKITVLIEEIAFQTDLLALNASVEASRAGEKGRGFAVVATEVRALAMRSARAATDIKDLIGQSTAQVSEGVDLVGRTDKALLDIFDNVHSLGAKLDTVEGTANKQREDLNAVDHAMGTLRELTKANTYLVAQNDVVSKDMNYLANSLADMVSEFKLAPAEELELEPAPDTQLHADDSKNAA